MISQADLGWMAAIMDTKVILIYKNNKTRASPQCVMVVESKHPAIISKLAQMTGLAPEARRTNDLKDWMQRGCVEHCPEPHVHHEEKWGMPFTKRWTVTGTTAAIVLYNLFPYLVTDKPYREFYGTVMEHAVTKGQGIGQVRTTVLRMRELGWEIPTGLDEAIMIPKNARIAV